MSKTWCVSCERSGGAAKGPRLDSRRGELSYPSLGRNSIYNVKTVVKRGWSDLCTNAGALIQESVRRLQTCRSPSVTSQRICGLLRVPLDEERRFSVDTQFSDSGLDFWTRSSELRVYKEPTLCLFACCGEQGSGPSLFILKAVPAARSKSWPTRLFSSPPLSVASHGRSVRPALKPKILPSPKATVNGTQRLVP